MRTPSIELARPIIEFYATLFKLPMMNVVSKQRLNPKWFCIVSAMIGKRTMNTEMPAKQTEIRCVSENRSASFGTSKPHTKLPTNKGIGNITETSPYSSAGYFSEKNYIPVRIAFHPISDAMPIMARAILWLVVTSVSWPIFLCSFQRRINFNQAKYALFVS